MPDILSSAPVLRDVDTGGEWPNSQRAVIVSHVTGDLMREEIDTSSAEAADPEQTHAQFDIPSASRAIFPVPDDMSSVPALCEVDTGGK